MERKQTVTQNKQTRIKRLDRFCQAVLREQGFTKNKRGVNEFHLGDIVSNGEDLFLVEECLENAPLILRSYHCCQLSPRDELWLVLPVETGRLLVKEIHILGGCANGEEETVHD